MDQMTKQEQMEADIAEIRRGMRDPDIMDAMIELVREGRIINSGERRAGWVVWISAIDPDEDCRELIAARLRSKGHRVRIGPGAGDDSDA
jgi:hypothetical protein